jgi:hypothetical protein
MHDPDQIKYAITHVPLKIAYFIIRALHDANIHYAVMLSETSLSITVALSERPRVDRIANHYRDIIMVEP